MKASSYINIAIVGASLGGLSMGNILNQLGYTVKIYEIYFEGFQNRGGALGMVDVDLVNIICGNKDLKNYRKFLGHGHFYGDLWNYFYQGLPKENIYFNVEIKKIIDENSSKPSLLIDGKKISFDLIIGADGGKSITRQYVSNQKPSYAGYTLWRGLVSTKDIVKPPSGQKTINGVYYQTLEFLCAGLANIGDLWNCGVYMAMPESEISPLTLNRQVTKVMDKIPKWFLPFIYKMFGEDNGYFWEECVKKGKVSAHSIWEFAPDRVAKNRIILLGDAAHLANPRTGAGAYTAMTDAVTMGSALKNSNSLDEAISIYNIDTVARGKKLFAKSRASAKYFSPRNKLIQSPEKILKNLNKQLNLFSTS